MKRRFALAACVSSLVLFFFCIPSAFAGGEPGNAPILYEISLDHPEQHLFHVTMKVPDVSGELTVEMPAWNALYQVRDFSSHVQEVDAFVGAEKVPIEKVDKQTWKIQGSGTVRIEYATYWDEPGPFASQLNGVHAFINPAMVLLYVPGRTEAKAVLSIANFPNDWQEASALKMACEPALGKPYCTSEKSTYDAIVDTPVEVGGFKEFSLPGVSADIRVVVHGEDWSQKEIESELSRICNYEVKMMGGAPFEHYTFILHIGKDAGGGGMEHANSTAIGIPSDDYLAGVAAHEFFHLWNVKRIRPASLWPVDFSKEQYTRALWFAEGVTSTYGAYTLVRTGIWSKDRFYDDLGEQITDLESRPANRWQSAEQSSLDAWLEKYPMYNGPNFSVSYYNKGQILGDLLDILIRDRTDNEKSLDDVLRGMNEDFAKQGKPYRDSLDIRLEAEKVAGGSFEEFFRDYVAGTKPLPYAQILARAGLTLQMTDHSRAILGFSAGRGSDGTITVRSVDAGTPAEQAGLQPGDAILSWDGGDVPRFLGRWVRERPAGEPVKLRIRRDEKEQTLSFKLGEEKETLYQIQEDAQAGERARRIRDGLLHGVTQTVAVH
ncbi:MAG: PDZ domain-containing protein [Candidatus Acidiferrum sp.]